MENIPDSNQNALQLGKLGSNNQRKGGPEFERARRNIVGISRRKGKADVRELYFNF